MAGRGVGRSVLSGEQSVRLLAAARRGRLITTLGALPSAEPVPFVAAGRQVVVRVTDGDSVRDGDVLSLQVDDIDERTGAGWSVLVTGSAHRLGPADGLADGMRARATEDWLDESGQLVLLANPLLRGVAISALPEPWHGPPPGGAVHEALRAAVALAERAPSAHAGAVLRWQAGEAGLDLHAVPAAGQAGRATLVTCGIALQHARTALVAAGWAVQTVDFPDPADAGHLARLRLVGRAAPQDRDLRLVEGARGSAAAAPPEEWWADLAAAAHFEDAVLHPLATDPTDPTDPADPAAGGPAAADRPAHAVLCTHGDDRRAWLRAGQAAGRVVLVAEAQCLRVMLPDGSVVTDRIRPVLSEQLPEGDDPQVLLRIGGLAR